MIKNDAVATNRTLPLGLIHFVVLVSFISCIEKNQYGADSKALHLILIPIQTLGCPFRGFPSPFLRSNDRIDSLSRRIRETKSFLNGRFRARIGARGPPGNIYGRFQTYAMQTFHSIVYFFSLILIIGFHLLPSFSSSSSSFLLLFICAFGRLG